MSVASALASTWLGIVLGSACCAVGSEDAQAVLAIDGPATATVFEVAEYTLVFGKLLAPFATLPDEQINDAYDADRDGVFVRVTGIFTSLKEPQAELRVPGFAMRDAPGGPWRWRLRWSPDRDGPWRLRVTVEGRSRSDAQPVAVEQLMEQRIAASVRADVEGPLVAPAGNDNPGCLRELRADGHSRATWLFGACRAWVVESDAKGLAWEPFEGIDRARDLFPVLRANGYNLLNQWMAPWEYLLVHHDRGEQWRSDDGHWHRHALPADAAWKPWACYDQGRAKAFDALVRQCEGGAGETTVRLLLAPLPHQCLEMHGGVWGDDADPTAADDAAAHLAAAKRCGFSAFKSGMSAWDFFAADPQAPHDDWRSRLFDAQANYYRYVIARWSASRAIGLWVLMDEIDAVGDAIGVRSRPSGWYAHPDCDRWLTRIADLFGGRIVGADGQHYDGDPYRHPLHAASTSFGGDFQPGANLEWTWSPPDGQARPEVVGWHWYPHWPADSTYDTAWRYAVDGILAFASSPDPGRHPRLISEFGGIDRASPEDEPTPLIRPSTTWRSGRRSSLAKPARRWIGMTARSSASCVGAPLRASSITSIIRSTTRRRSRRCARCSTVSAPTPRTACVRARPRRACASPRPSRAGSSRSLRHRAPMSCTPGRWCRARALPW